MRFKENFLATTQTKSYLENINIHYVFIQNKESIWNTFIDVNENCDLKMGQILVWEIGIRGYNFKVFSKKDICYQESVTISFTWTKYNNIIYFPIMYGGK